MTKSNIARAREKIKDLCGWCGVCFCVAFFLVSLISILNSAFQKPTTLASYMLAGFAVVALWWAIGLGVLNELLSHFDGQEKKETERGINGPINDAGNYE